MRGLSRFQQAVVGILVVLVVVAGSVFLFGGSSSRPTPPADTSGARGPGTVAASDLPPQARQTIARIKAGGPYLYSRDGVVFENREALLPIEPSGFYHEYTVPTPGAPDRGSRRIVSGAGGFYFYTADHYRSFRQIILSR